MQVAGTANLGLSVPLPKGKEINKDQTPVIERIAEGSSIESIAQGALNQTLENANPSKLASEAISVVRNPAVRTKETVILEQGVKAIIENFDSVEITKSFGSITINFNGKKYDLIELLQNANLNALALDKKDYANLGNLFRNKHGISQKSIEKLNDIENYHTYTAMGAFEGYKETNKNEVERFQENSIYIYTLPSYFNIINRVIRGDINYFFQQKSYGDKVSELIKLTLINAVLMTQGINRSLIKVMNVTRIENSDTLPESEKKARQECIEGRLPYITAKAFTSTSLPGDRKGWVGGKIIVKFDYGVGKLLTDLSIFPENELLMPPETKIQYYKITQENDKTIYHARIIETELIEKELPEIKKTSSFFNFFLCSK